MGQPADHPPDSVARGPPPLRIWLDVGTKEGRVANYQARLLRDTPMAKGWVLGGDLRYFEADNAPHSEWAWAERVGPMLRTPLPGPDGTRMRRMRRIGTDLTRGHPSRSVSSVFLTGGVLFAGTVQK